MKKTCKIISDSNHIFEHPTRICFTDPHDGATLYGIGHKNEIICGCCGTTYSLRCVMVNRNPIFAYDWTDLTDCLEEKE